MITLIHLSIVCALLLILYPFIRYLRDEKHLRRFPAASPLAAITPLWIMYHNLQGRRFLAVHAAHQRQGPAVRISPNHISFAAPTAYKDIYGHGSSIVKDLMYDNFAGGNPSMADTTSRALHSAKRKNLAFVFSARQIAAMEPRIISTVETLLHAVRVKSAGGNIAPTDRFPARPQPDGSVAFDLRPWLNLFSYDAISAMFWSQPYGFLSRGDDDCLAQDADGRVHRVHAMETFHNGIAFAVVLGHLPPFFYRLIKNRLLVRTWGNQCATNFTGMARWLVSERLKSPPAEPDLFSNLPVEPTEKRPEPMGFDEMVAECTTMLNAGNDTTQTSLTNAMHDLAAHPAQQRKLRGLLREAIAAHAATSPDAPSPPSPIASYNAILQHVPYLRACLDESFRLHPPVGIGLPRRTVAPTHIAGHLVPAGVTVSAPTFTLHRNETLFHDADAWVPERWLEGALVGASSADCDSASERSASPSHDEKDTEKDSDSERANLASFVFPFSLGGRACIGRNLAYMELSIVVAALVSAFEWELAGGKGDEKERDVEEEGGGLRHFERFNSNPVELVVRARPVEVEVGEKA